jgi:FtsZ-interacting cell division protein YlmF
LFHLTGAVGGDDANDDDKEKAEEEERERQEAIREAEERRKEKHRKMEEEREKMRQEIRDKVSMDKYIDVHGNSIYVQTWVCVNEPFIFIFIYSHFYFMTHIFLHLITHCRKMNLSFFCGEIM